MTRGKKICKILKEIRQQIAEKNDIEYITSECTFQGECQGTCPKCEAEVRYLENELRKRRQLGKVVVIAGVSLGVAGSFAACGNNPVSDFVNNFNSTEGVVVADSKPIVIANLPDSATVDTIVPKCNGVNNQPPPEIIEITNIYPIEGDIAAPVPLLGDLISTPIDQPEIIERFPDIKAEPPGDMATLRRWLEGNIRYPQGAVVENIGGTVVVEFVVRANGSIDNVKVVKKVHPLLDQEAVRVIKLMKEWKPGSSDGVAVSSYFQLPVQFKLPKE